MTHTPTRLTATHHITPYYTANIHTPHSYPQGVKVSDKYNVHAGVAKHQASSHNVATHGTML